MAVSLFYQAPAASHDKIFFSAIYPQNGAVMKAYERSTFFQLQVYERVTFSVKMVHKRVRGQTSGQSLLVLVIIKD